MRVYLFYQPVLYLSPSFVTAVLQSYEARVNDEFILRGNTAIIKCIVPSFVADFVHVVAWIVDNTTLDTEQYSNVDSGSVAFKLS